MPEQQQIHDPPTAQVIDMMQQGYPIEQVKSSLQSMGFSQEMIMEALAQAHAKMSVEDSAPPAPSPAMHQSIFDEEHAPIRTPPTSPPQLSSFAERGSQERVEELIESVIEEKWQRVLEDIGSLSAWKDKVRNDVLSLKQEMLRLESRFENLVGAVTGKIKDYDQGIENVGTDIKALEKLLQHIITPLSTNVKELSRITEALKKTKK